MAQLTIQIPDNQANRIVNAFASRFGYNAQTDGTKAQFMKVQLIKYLKSVVIDVEDEAARKSARQTVVNDVEGISLT